MTTRMTGITGLLDTDSLVSASMLPYKTKVSTKKQDKQVMQWQQQQYQQIMKDSKSFYNKYLDISGTNSLSLLSKYTTAKFTSNNESAVTATASDGAAVDNYTVSVEQLASKATANLGTSVSGGQKITIGKSGIEIDFVADAADGTKTVTNYNNAVSTKMSDLNAIVNDSTKTAAEKTTAKAQISDLNSVTATYSSFSKSVVFSATQMGLGGYQADNTTPNASFTLNGTAVTDVQAKATITNSKNQPINYVGNSNVTTVDGIIFNFKTPTVGQSTSNLTDLVSVPDLTDLATTNGTSTTSGDGTKTTTKSADGTKTTTTSADGRKTITVTNGATTTKTTTSADGRKTITAADGTITTTAADGTKTITSSDGNTITTTSSDGTKTTETTTTGGVTSTKTTIQNSVTLTGTTDITDFKTNIKSFVDDYNTLLLSINTKIYETRDKNYKPLTDDQKKDMKETEITNWQTKAQTGLLRNDDNLEELANNMKSAMSTFMSSAGLSLENIGIKPVKDYSDKNGTFTIDDAKLTTALQQNFDGVKDLFTNGMLTSDTTNGGIITKLKKVVNDNAILSTSNLAQKAGNDSAVSLLTNEMTLKLNDMTKQISEMESSLTDRENTLYTKYSKVESVLSKLQAQQSSLDSYFTSGS